MTGEGQDVPFREPIVIVTVVVTEGDFDLDRENSPHVSRTGVAYVRKHGTDHDGQAHGWACVPMQVGLTAAALADEVLGVTDEQRALFAAEVMEGAGDGH